MRDSSHEQDAERKKTQGQEEQVREETNHELRETRAEARWRIKERRRSRDDTMDEALRRLEENEEYRKVIEYASAGSEGEVPQNVQNYLAHIHKVSSMNKEQFEHLECGVWRAVEARRKGRGRRARATAADRARAKHRTGAGRRAQTSRM